ncbi:MAG: hypothetical protein AB8G15_16635 [Saprospiraceae bacterium]
MKMIVTSCLFLILGWFTTDSGKMDPISTSQTTTSSYEEKAKMKGVNFVAPPQPFAKNPMPAVKQVNANWIAVVPLAYTRVGKPTVRYNIADYQWWGEKPEGVKKTIALAKAEQLKIMLKPQVYIPGSWPGGLDFEHEADWEKWEADYTKYIMEMLDIAIAYKVEVFCVGTEFKIGVRKREAYWRALISEIRGKYQGKLTYAANWDSYETLPIWDALDIAGIDAYFPLTESKTPTVKELKKAWKPTLQKIRHFHKKQQIPILFTEYGYLSVDGCAGKNWELEGKINRLPINEQAQANALDALFTVFWEEPYWQGGFIWKWFPNLEGGEGYNHKDYTPQGKLGARVMSWWYAR